MKFGNLAGGIGLCIGLSACATQRSAEPSAPAASAPAAEGVAAKPESPGAAPAPPPPAPVPRGLDSQKSAKGAEAEVEFSSLEEAERALNQAKADLDRLALAEPAPVLGETSDRHTRKNDSKPARAPSAAGAAAPTKTSACEETCRAFSSLTRAANAVCRLDGKGGSHCSRAKQVLADAQQRVASCSCPAASD